MGTKGAEAVAAASGAAGLTDTDILIDAARGVADAIAFLNAQRFPNAQILLAGIEDELMTGHQPAPVGPVLEKRYC